MTALSRMTDPSNGTSLSWLTASLLSPLWRWELSYLFPQLFFPFVASYPQFKVFFFVFESHYHFAGKCKCVSVKEGEVCDGLRMCLCAYMLAFLHTACVCVHMCMCSYVCSNCCCTWAKYERKSVDGRHSPLIAWLINQPHWLHVDPGLLSGGLAQGPLWAHNDSFAHRVRASSGL